MKLIKKIRSLYWHTVLHCYRKMQFKRFCTRALVLSPLQIDGAKNISIGNHTVVGKGCWLSAVPLTNERRLDIIIGDGVRIGHFNHIYCTSSIIIEDDVLTADKVYIADNLHSYEDTNTPICKQPIKQLKPVVIGRGAWLGENVCVIGACIGKGSVIGANSVVTKDIPDYCVAVGSPARVIKRYNFETKTWNKI